MLVTPGATKTLPPASAQDSGASPASFSIARTSFIMTLTMRSATPFDAGASKAPT